MSSLQPPAPHQPAESSQAVIEAEILRRVRSLRFGALEIQIHDSRVVQIEERSRVRFDGQGRTQR